MGIEKGDIERVILGKEKPTARRNQKFGKATEKQMQTLSEFDEYLRTTGRNLKRRYLFITYLRHWITNDMKMEFQDICDKDLQKYRRDLESANRPKNSIGQYEINLKIFFKWLYKGRENRDKLEDLIDWMKEINHQKSSKNREAQETLEHISLEMTEQLLPFCLNRRNEAIIMALWETGYRAEELLSLNIGDIKDTGNGWIFKHKNLRQTFTLYRSKPFIEKWLEIHPEPNNDNTPLWTSAKTKRMGYQNLSRLLKELGNRAGIKGLRAHLFRHEFGTYWASRITENELKTAMGHSSTSSVTRYYVHLKMEGIRKKQAEIEGLEILKELETHESILKPQICKSCATHNAHNSTFCSGCGDPLTEIGENKREGQIADLKNQIDELSWTVKNLTATPDYGQQINELRAESESLKRQNEMLQKQMISREELVEMIKLKA